jgi:protein-S-isoprenylcysteine O-methyltransferase Ste14
MIISLFVFGAFLFLVAGRIGWTAGWVYLGMNGLIQLLSGAILIPRQAGMLAERSRVRAGTKTWDLVLAPAITILGTLGVLATAALDVRLGWSRPPFPALWACGVALAFACQLFVLWAMASNPFFAATVRIQAERGHEPTRGGPYGLMRHPGYAGAFGYTLLVPVVLGSWWAFIPALASAVLIIVRTGLEDRTLHDELVSRCRRAKTAGQSVS